MSATQSDEHPPLNQSLYNNLDEKELEFWSVQTGIKDREELKQHIVGIQKQIYKVCGAIDRDVAFLTKVNIR